MRLCEEHQHLPEITFIDKRQAFLIRRTLPRVPNCVDIASQDDSENEEDVAEELEWPFEDDTDETLADEQHEEITDEQRKEEDEHEVSADDLTKIPCSDVVDLESLNDFTEPKHNAPVNDYPNIAEQNILAVREQHLTDLHMTTSSYLHQIATNLRSYQNIKAPETAGLISNLESLVNSAPYMDALAQVSQLSPKIKRQAEAAGFYPLEVEKKQRRHQSFSSF